MSIWDNPELRTGGDYIKFDNIGDSVSGTISAIRAHRFDDGSVAPQLLLTTDDGEEKTLTAGQVRLKTALAEQRPEAGDHVRIALTNVEKRAGGKSLKHFEVTITRGGQPQAATVAATATATSVAQPAAAAVAPAGVSPEALAALAKLTPEQKAMLGLS